MTSMENTPNVAIDKPPVLARIARFRDALAPWPLRIVATVCWLSFAARESLAGGGGGLFGRLSAAQLLLAYVVAGSLYMLLKRERGLGCFVIALSPLYIILWPIIAALLVLVWGMTTTLTVAKSSQTLLWSLLPLTVTAVSVWTATSRPTIASIGLVALIATANLVVVLVSVITWVFVPLRWITSLLPWLLRFQHKLTVTTALPTVEEVGKDPVAARVRFRTAIHERLSALESTRKSPRISEEYQDVLLLVGFARKFLVALVHTALLFALLHWSTAVSEQGAAAYSGLPLTGFRDAWFYYVDFAFMSLVTGQTAIAPVSSIARLVTLINTLWGVGYLVLLVTAFSMLSRDRARAAATSVTAAINQTGLRLETELSDAVVFGHSHHLISEDVVKELEGSSALGFLSSERYEMVRGIGLAHEVAYKLQMAGMTQLAAEAWGLAARVPLGRFDQLYRTIVARGSPLSAEIVVQEMRLLVDQEVSVGSSR
jgi:hypothetical protein